MPIDTGRLKHLEMIQQVISRLAGNSFLIKGWSLTLLSAILAIALIEKAYAMVWVAFVPCLMFWLLDAFFLRQERLFRLLWDLRRSEAQESSTDFSMDTSSVQGRASSWLATAFSRTLLTFHGTLVAVLVLVALLAPGCR